MDLTITWRGGRRSVAIIWGSLAVLLVLTACGADTDAPLEKPSATNTASGSAAAKVPGSDVKDTALHQYIYTPVEFATVTHAASLLTADCMERFGFSYPVPKFTDAVQETQKSEAEVVSRLYGPTNRADAEKYGYMPASLYAESPAPAAPGSDSEAFAKVLYAGKLPGRHQGEKPTSPGEVDGVEIPPGGCLGDAWTQIAGNPDGLGSQLGRRLFIQSNFRAQSDPQWRSVVDEWAACLAQDGYQVTDPLNDEGDIKKIMVSDEEDTMASAAEIKLALADIACKEQVNFVRRLNAIDLKYAEEMVEDRQLVLGEERSRLDKLLKSASAIVEKE